MGRLLQSEVISNVSPRRQNRLVDLQLIDYGRFSFQAFCDYFCSIDTLKKSKMARELKVSVQVNMPRKALKQLADIYFFFGPLLI